MIGATRPKLPLDCLNLIFLAADKNSLTVVARASHECWDLALDILYRKLDDLWPLLQFLEINEGDGRGAPLVCGSLISVHICSPSLIYRKYLTTERGIGSYLLPTGSRSFHTLRARGDYPLSTLSRYQNGCAVVGHCWSWLEGPLYDGRTDAGRTSSPTFVHLMSIAQA